MDPDANLKEQLELSAECQRIWDACPEDGEFTAEQKDRLAEIGLRLPDLVVALNDWITKGGFLPAAWRNRA